VEALPVSKASVSMKYLAGNMDKSNGFTEWVQLFVGNSDETQSE
jgi:hypothetical protein